MNCARCGAVLEPSVIACQYCGAPTANAERVHAEERNRQAWADHHKAQDAQVQNVAATQRMEAAAKNAFVLSLVSIPLCCVPVLQVVAFVFYFRARALAKQLSVPVPGKATAGLAISIVTLLSFGAAMIAANIRSAKLEESSSARIGELEKTTVSAALAPTLEKTTACGLAELYTLKNGHDSQLGYNFMAFDCVGKLTLEPERAKLEDFQFKEESGGKLHKVAVCFKRSEKWYVAELAATGNCPGSAAPVDTKKKRP